jgi:hypothetical protein
MFNSLLVHIPSERAVRPAVDGSISLASACGAHLNAFRSDMNPPIFLSPRSAVRRWHRYLSKNGSAP